MKEGEYIVEEDPFERELSAARVGLDIRELEESVLFIYFHTGIIYYK